MSWMISLVIILSIHEISTQKFGSNGVKKKSTDCESHEKCSDCLHQLECVWCIEPFESFKTNNESTMSHCVLRNSIEQVFCPPDLLIDPSSSETIITQRPLQSAQSDNVQITPQQMKLTLRLGEEYKFNFQYAQAKNYPIDLYYVMDYSASMEVHRMKLAKLGNKLAETMKKITSNFRIGFGSFVDKLDMPFVSTIPEKLITPCTFNKGKYKIQCVSPYSFKNHMSLSTNHTKFSSQVSEAQVSGNLDTPEGGFDALMQAIVCKKEIGWRYQARHLLVFSTDAEFHIAGDGKLAGVLIPNDGKCHMSGDEYEGYLTYDYPSVSHLNYVARKNNINLIFAIVKSDKDVLRSYEFLSDSIENSNVGALDENSENVIDLVLDNYNKIVDSVLIETNSTENVEIKLTSNCTKPIKNGCSDIHVGEIVNFTASIKALSCAGYNGTPITISFKPAGIDESLTIELDLICGCDCEVPRNPYNFPNSANCSGFGDMVCGVCNCLPGRYGSQCECDGQHSHTLNETNCIQMPGDPVCSGLGTCKCGKCECFSRPNSEQKISGKYCQCDNYSCNREHGLLCAGRGKCSCGRCLCNAGWSGSACECPDGNSTCIREGHSDDGVCSGRGTCKCGKCECSESELYTGKYCEDCPTCMDRCNEVRDCVECKVFRTGTLKGGDCELKCTPYVFQEVEEIKEDELRKGERMCRFLDRKTCSILYKYYYDGDKNLIVKVQKYKRCPPNALVWTLGVIGTIVLAALVMLLVWKLFTTIHDRREYVKFENERKNLKWHRDENPLYRDAITTFKNPCYNT
ncbi:hypothetical protein HHI36_005908 [Cryptolaemus montrouzieri]|uniref:Integrin beta n=1 Tax=Cryptolaemus montrouzieri TaxID=559131 RepID=A0ABD2NVP9_9CUCU